MRHPETGKSYIAVVPRQPAFTEIRAAYRKLSADTSWFSMISTDAFHAALDQYRSEDVVFAHWSPWCVRPADLPQDRKAMVWAVYSEAYDDDHGKLLPDHQRDLRSFVAMAHHFDGIFTHTPWMSERIGALTGRPTVVLPVGWDPVMGTPNWEATKTVSACFHGSYVGRRVELLPEVYHRCALDLIWGRWGKDLSDLVDLAKCVLYIAHSPVHSYSTWRLWQACSASACYVTERGDFWPLTDDLCIPIEPVTKDNAHVVAEMIREVSFEEASRKARALHETLRMFTTRSCVESGMVIGTQRFSR